LAELYGAEVSSDLISPVTDAVLDEVRQWQNRPLDPVYPVVFFDALRVKIRDEGLVKNRLSMSRWRSIRTVRRMFWACAWIEQTEGAKFWLKVINELKTRGVNDILIGLKGFPEAIASVYPQTVVQTCIVHLIYNSLAFVSWKHRGAILPAIKAIYRAENADMALVGPAREVRSQVGQALLDDRPGLAPRLGARDSVLRLRPRHPQNDLHYQSSARGVATQFAQDHQDPRQLSQRRRGVEAALPRNQECRLTVAAKSSFPAVRTASSLKSD
jgi:hypothetical protein